MNYLIILGMLSIAPLLGNEEGSLTSLEVNPFEIDPTSILEICRDVESSAHYRVVRNALVQKPLWEIAIDWDVLSRQEFSFSHEVPYQFSISDQKKAGTCWIHAGLNHLRILLSDKYNVGNIALSPNYLIFYDKIEKANYYLTMMAKHFDLPLDDRELSYVIHTGTTDGGYFESFTSLVQKYGVVPDYAYRQNYSAENSGCMNLVLQARLTKGAEELRRIMNSSGAWEDALAEKDRIMKDIVKILTIHMGTPPEKFDWTYFDEDEKSQTVKNVTPLEFAKEYIGFNCLEYISFVHSPRESTPYNKVYTIDINTMVGGRPLCFLNVPMDEFKEITATVLKEKKPVYFACDMHKYIDYDHGIMDINIFAFSDMYGIDLTQSKAAQMELYFSRAVHAMVFTGVHIEDEKPVRWKVENSWGADIGHWGYFIMSDNWFNQYVYRVDVPVSLVPQEYLDILKNEKPIILPPWDPLEGRGDYVERPF